MTSSLCGRRSLRSCSSRRSRPRIFRRWHSGCHRHWFHRRGCRSAPDRLQCSRITPQTWPHRIPRIRRSLRYTGPIRPVRSYRQPCHSRRPRCRQRRGHHPCRAATPGCIGVVGRPKRRGRAGGKKKTAKNDLVVCHQAVRRQHPCQMAMPHFVPETTRIGP